MPTTAAPLVIEEVKRLRLEPGDALVVRIPRIGIEQARAIEESLKPSFPDNLILVTEPGTELEVVGPGGQPPSASSTDIPRLSARKTK